MDIAIYGAGGFGRDLYCLITNHIKNPEWNFIGFFSDVHPKGAQVRFGATLGGIDDLNRWESPIGVIIAQGYPRALKSIRDKIVNPLVSFPNMIMPGTFFYDKDSFSIGEGNIICQDCNIGSDVVMGDFNVLNGMVCLGHDVKIGNFNSMMPSVHISGNVEIGDINSFGVGSLVVEKIHIGNETTLGAGSLLFKAPKDGKTYIGNPAKMFDY